MKSIHTSFTSGKFPAVEMISFSNWKLNQLHAFGVLDCKINCTVVSAKYISTSSTYELSLHFTRTVKLKYSISSYLSDRLYIFIFTDMYSLTIL